MNSITKTLKMQNLQRNKKNIDYLISIHPRYGDINKS